MQRLDKIIINSNRKRTITIAWNNSNYHIRYPAQTPEIIRNPKSMEIRRVQSLKTETLLGNKIAYIYNTVYIYIIQCIYILYILYNKILYYTIPYYTRLYYILHIYIILYLYMYIIKKARRLPGGSSPGSWSHERQSHSHQYHIAPPSPVCQEGRHPW